NLLERVAQLLLAADNNEDLSAKSVPRIHLIREAFELADSGVRDALRVPIEKLRSFAGDCVRNSSLAELCSDDRAGELNNWLMIYRVLQGTEFDSCLGSWIVDALPEMGPAMSAGLESVRKLDRTRINEPVALRAHFARRLNAPLAAGDL